MQNPKNKFRESMEEARGRDPKEQDGSGDEDGWGGVKSPFSNQQHSGFITRESIWRFNKRMIRICERDASSALKIQQNPRDAALSG